MASSQRTTRGRSPQRDLVTLSDEVRAICRELACVWKTFNSGGAHSHIAADIDMLADSNAIPMQTCMLALVRVALDVQSSNNQAALDLMDQLCGKLRAATPAVTTRGRRSLA